MFKLFKRKKITSLMLMAILAMAALPLSASAAPPSQEIDFGSGGFTFQLADIMGSSWNFIEQFNTYVILILALILVPTLVGFVIWLMSKVPRFRRS